MLREILEPRVNEDDPEGLVFSNNGKLISVATLNAHFKKICKNAGIRPTTYQKKKTNGTYTTVNTSEVFQYQLRHLYASLGVLLKAEPKALQMLMGHAKIKTTMDIYAEAQNELQQETAETIDEFISYLTYEGTSEDMETLFKKIKELDLNTLEESTVKIFKQELISLANIPKLEEQVKNIILELSNIGQVIPIGDLQHINQDNRTRLKLTYSLLDTLDQFKTQTKNIKKNGGKNVDYEYTLNYIATTQKLLNMIDKANGYEPTKPPRAVRTVSLKYISKSKTCITSNFQLK